MNSVERVYAKQNRTDGTRRFLAVFLCLLLCLICASAMASSKGKYGKLTWKLDNKGVLTISGQGKMNDFAWDKPAAWRKHPSEIKKVVISQGVTSISKCAFWDCKALQSISIPKSVKTIGDAVFGNCSKLKEVTIPAGVTKMNGYTFYDSAVTKVKIAKSSSAFCNMDGAVYSKNKKVLVYVPAGMAAKSFKIRTGTKTIGDYSFYNSRLETITIPKGVTDIGARAFEFCGELKKLVIPQGVKTIGGEAFNFCHKLTSVSLPASLKEGLDGSDFQGCESLKKVEVNKANAYYKSKDGCLYNKNMTCLLLCVGGQSGEAFRFPSTVTEVGSCAFRNCHYSAVILPEGMQTIPSAAFYISGIRSIYISKSVTFIGSYAFCGAPIENVYYGGTESGREKIVIEEHNDALAEAVWHYKASPSDVK